jgi:hypothetical protein
MLRRRAKMKMSPEFPALVFADIHAQKSNLKELTYFFRTTVPQLYDDHRFKSIIIIGDVFESVSKIDTEVYITIYTLLKDIHYNLDRVVDVFIVMGNHDIYMLNGASPLIPFKEIATVYDTYTYERDTGFEFIPYSHNMNREYATDSGITFIHYALKGIVDSIKLNYPIEYFEPPCTDRTYIAGHLHFPKTAYNQISVGNPIPYMFDPVEKDNYVYILEGPTKLVPVKMDITKYHVLDVYDPDDLYVTIEHGLVSTHVKLKLYNDCLSASRIMEFKKTNNLDSLVVSREVKSTKLKGTLRVEQANQPLSVYRQFIQQDATPLDKRALFLKVRDILNEDKVPQTGCSEHMEL